MLVTFEAPMVPEPLVTMHDSPLGCVATVTEYGAPSATGVAKVNGPLALMTRLSPPLFWRMTVPAKPERLPPMVYVLVEQVTDTLVTFTAPTMPVPLPTVQVWVAGCVSTVTEYGLPCANGAGKVNVPSLLMLNE